MVHSLSKYYLSYLLSARKADLKKGFQHLVVLVVVLVVIVGFFLNNTPSLFVAQHFYSRGDRKA